MAKKVKEIIEDTEAEAPAEAEVTLIVEPVTPPEIAFRLREDAGDEVSATISGVTRSFEQGQAYRCTRAEWLGLKGSQLFELAEVAE